MLKGCVFYYTMSSSIVEITFTQKMTRTPQPSPMSTLQPGIGVHKPKSPLFFAKFPKKSQQCKYYSTGLSRTPIQAVSKLVWTMSKTFKHIDFCGWTTNEDGGFKKSYNPQHYTFLFCQ